MTALNLQSGDSLVNYIRHITEQVLENTVYKNNCHDICICSSQSKVEYYDGQECYIMWA